MLTERQREGRLAMNRRIREAAGERQAKARADAQRARRRVAEARDLADLRWIELQQALTAYGVARESLVALDATAEPDYPEAELRSLARTAIAERPLAGLTTRSA